METCTTSKKNISLAQCVGNYGVPIGFYFQEDVTNEGLSYADALLEANWITEINKATGERLYVPCPKGKADVYTWSGDESQRTRTSTGKNIENRKGYTEFNFTYYNLTVAQYVRLATMNNQSGLVYVYTDNGDILGQDTGTNIKGMEADIFVSNFVPAETNEAQSTVIVTVSIKETNSPITKAIPSNEMDF